MHPGIACIACLLIGAVAGNIYGQRHAPEAFAYQRERDAVMDEQFEMLLQEPGSRELVCERIFELVEGELTIETFDIQEARSE